MEQIIKKYADKLILAGLGGKRDPHRPLVGGLDDTLVWSREAAETGLLEQVFARLNITSLTFLRPVEPYAGIIAFLAQKALAKKKSIEPKDCETRTFLHDLPVIEDLNPESIAAMLKRRKSVIVCAKDAPGVPVIIAHGTVSPEQGFVTVSSVAFACFVKFYADFLDDLRLGRQDPYAVRLFDQIRPGLTPLKTSLPELMPPPFTDEETVYKAIIQAGKKTVEYDLVDSYFGNVSYLWKNTLYISQTGSSLDELSACIDPVPLDGSTSAGLTASSELSAHLKAVHRSGCRAILHGHPKFSVILSMDCDPDQKASCRLSDQCHIKCPEKRMIGPTPIVPGEVGTGPTGLCNTLPPALEASGNAIVYGHGVFATGKQGFSEAFAMLLEVENYCRNLYFDTVDGLRKRLGSQNGHNL